uniref:Pyruvate kinase n=1 Tax=Eutreptiella gymnastica TaxID=73025 RepID=A0A7S1IH01_9EUGL|mmetsp:Transcript_17898/g.31756  ORF Transcript_17898/g.31756 Transcript_17898/m.31756 type:complete len:544 (+) Transcript_17898:26-1657(+)
MEATGETMSYLSKHNIPQTLDAAVKNLLAVQPEDPKAFLAQQLAAVGTKPAPPIPDVTVMHTPQSRETSIICTIGPKVANAEMLGKLMDTGMDVTRMNFSHGTYEWFEGVISSKKEAEASRPGKWVALALDTKGPEIRTGLMSGGEITVIPGSEVVVTTNEEFKTSGTASRIYVDYKDLPTTVKPGGLIYMDDGLLGLKVIECSGMDVKCVAINGATLSDRRGVNLPNARVTLPAVSEKDKADITFGCKNGIDVIFASFIRTAAQVQEIKDLLKSLDASHVMVFSKIENQEGIDNFDEILKATDGVMVARGDLGIEIPAQKVFTAQKMLIRKCNIAAKPVICATQMLESMIVNPRPTRAEVSDVGNAIADGADCVMLSGETAKGKWPLEAVSMMCDVCLEAEAMFDGDGIFRYMKDITPRPISSMEAMARSAVSLSFDEDFAMIIVVSEAGTTQKYVAKYRPRCPIFVVTNKPHIARQGVFLRGVISHVVESFGNVNELLELACNVAKTKGIAQRGQKAIAVYDSDLSDGIEDATTCRVIEIR